MVRKLCELRTESGIASSRTFISPAVTNRGFKVSHTRQSSFPTDESATRQGNIVTMVPSVTAQIPLSAEDQRALEDQLWQFSSPYEAEIALKLCLTKNRFYRTIFGLRGEPSVNDTRIRELYDLGDEMYTSSFWSINHALFLLDLAQAEYNAWNSAQQNRGAVGGAADLAAHFERRKVIQHKLACTLEDCLALKHPLDHKFLLYYACQLKLEHDILSSGSSYGGNVASTRSVTRKLKRAAEHFRAIIAWTKRLWKKLLENDADLSDFSDIVASIDEHETECEKIYKQVIMDSPSVRVYRAYAKFLAEIRKNYDLADQYLDMANMLEETNNVVRPVRNSNNMNGSHYSISSATSSSTLNRPIPARRGGISLGGDNNSNNNNNSSSSTSVLGDGFLNSGAYNSSNTNQVTPTKKNLARFSLDSNKITPLSAPPMGPMVPSTFLGNTSLADLGEASSSIDLLNPTTATAADLSSLPPPVQNGRDGMALAEEFKTDSRINNNSGGGGGSSEDDLEYKRQQQQQQTRLLRSKIESADYSAVDRIKKTVLISLIGIMLLLTSSFIQSQILLSQFKGRAYATNLVGEFGREAIGVALAVRRLEVYRQNKVPGFAINPLALSTYASSLTDILDALYPPSSAELTELWNEKDVPLLTYYYDPDSAKMYSVTENTTLLDAATTFQRKTFALSNNGLLNITDFVNNTDVGFVLQNGPNSIVASFLAKVKAYRQYYIREDQHYLWILTAQLIVSVIAIFFIVPVILIVTSRQLIEEKRSIIRMFLLIPKSTVSKIIENLDAIHGDDDDALDASTELGGGTGGGGAPTNKKNNAAQQKRVSNFNVLIIRYIIIVLFLFACSASFTAIGYLTIHWFQTEIAQVELSTQRRINAFYLEMSAIEHIYDSPFKITLGTASSNGGNSTAAQMLTRIADNLRNLHLRLRAGDPSYGIKSTDLTDAQKSLYYDARCSDLSNITCMSLTQLISYYTDVCDSLAMIAPDHFSNVSINMYLTIHRTEKLLDTLLEQSTTIYRQQNWTKITDCTSATIAIFVLCIPLLIFFYLVPLRSSMRNIKKEGEQTREMLLLLPTNVIMETTAIYNYLMKGQQAHKVRRDIATALNQAKERTQSVLQASVDGVIEFGEDLSINIFNHSAEKMLQYQYTDIIGKPVTQLLVESDAQQLLETIQQFIGGGSGGNNNNNSSSNNNNNSSHPHTQLHHSSSSSHQLSFVKEITAVRQDGSSFPARISLCAVSDATNRYTFVIFLRDITTERKQQELLIAEKKRSEDMLLNILPRSIATRLQNGETLIADSHEEITICFIDLVQFTRMTSDLSPTKLISMLNDLTSIVDSLCQRFGVEKIKTIGDAWLLASGLPLPRYDHAHAMLELCLCLLEELEKYNAEHGTKLQMRIGINTGPVVAGVIGTKKMMYDLWGDNVNIASRMESNGVPGRIQVSRSTYSLVYDQYVWEDRGEIDVKGKGKLNAYLVVRRK